MSTIPAQGQVTPNTIKANAGTNSKKNTRDTQTGETDYVLAQAKAEIENLRRAQAERQAVNERQLSEIEASFAALKSDVSELKQNEPSLFKRLLEVLVGLVAIAAFALSMVQHFSQRRRETPRAKGRALLEWAKESSGLPKPNFRLELRNDTDREVKLVEVAFYLRSDAGPETTQVEAFPGKLRVLPAREAMEMEVPDLQILDVVRVEARSPTGDAWAIEWDMGAVRHIAWFENLQTAFFANDDAEQWALNLFAVGNRFYVSKRSHSPDHGTSDNVDEFNAEADAHIAFNRLCSDIVNYRHGSRVGSEKIYTVSDARTDFRKYWK